MLFRKDLNDDLNHEAQVALRDLIRAFLDDEEMIHEHMAIVGTRTDPKGENFPNILERGVWDTRDLHENLWHGHRYYISKLEDFLMTNGGQRFVPLPKWDADRKIPTPFSFVHPHQPPLPPINFDVYNSDVTAPSVHVPAGRFGPITIPGGTITAGRPQVPDALKDANIGNFNSSIAMAAEVTPYHFDVHLKLGGVMKLPHDAAAASIFWVWHAALEEFYYKWTLRKLDKCRGLVVGHNDDGRLQTFVIGNDNEVWQSTQWWRYSGWSYWQTIHGFAKQIVVETDKEGRLDLCVIGAGDRVEHRRQEANKMDWGPWGPVGDHHSRFLAIAKNKDSRLELFSIDSNNRLWHVAQNAGLRWGEWKPIGHDKQIYSLTVGRHPSGILEVFAIGFDHRAWGTHQTEPGGGNWTAWHGLSGPDRLFIQLACERGADRKLVLVGIDFDHPVYFGHVPERHAPVPVANVPGHRVVGGTQPPPAAAIPATYPFGEITWHKLGTTSARSLVIGRNQQSRLEVFAIGIDRRLKTVKQETDSFDSWGQWSSSLGDDIGTYPDAKELEEIAVARNDRSDPPTVAHGRLPDGTLEVFGKVKEDITYHKWSSPDGWGRWRRF